MPKLPLFQTLVVLGGAVFLVQMAWIIDLLGPIRDQAAIFDACVREQMKLSFDDVSGVEAVSRCNGGARQVVD